MSISFPFQLSFPLFCLFLCVYYLHIYYKYCLLIFLFSFFIIWSDFLKNPLFTFNWKQLYAFHMIFHLSTKGSVNVKSPSALDRPGGIRLPCMVTDRWLSHQINPQLTQEKGDHWGTNGHRLGIVCYIEGASSYKSCSWALNRTSLTHQETRSRSGPNCCKNTSNSSLSKSSKYCWRLLRRLTERRASLTLWKPSVKSVILIRPSPSPSNA